MEKINIALGLYSVFDEMNKDMEGTFLKISAMGYKGVEFYGDLVYDIKKLKAALSDSNLKLYGWHVPWNRMQDDVIDSTIAYSLEAENPRIVIPCLGGPWNVAHDREEECMDIWLRHTQTLEKIYKRLKNYGLKMGYHNHAHEFNIKYNEKTVFDIFFENLDPEIFIELDTGSALEGGADPVKVLETYKGRVELLHCKAFSDNRINDLTIGEEDDKNDWISTRQACERHGVKLWIVEYESNSLSHFTGSEMCLKGLKIKANL